MKVSRILKRRWRGEKWAVASERLYTGSGKWIYKSSMVIRTGILVNEDFRKETMSIGRSSGINYYYLFNITNITK